MPVHFDEVLMCRHHSISIDCNMAIQTQVMQKLFTPAKDHFRLLPGRVAVCEMLLTSSMYAQIN